MGPSDSRPARRPFTFGLWAAPSSDVNRRDGSLLFRTGLCPHALRPTPRASCTAPEGKTRASRTGAVCCLRRDMSGSAGPTFRVFLSRGCTVRLLLGLRTCSPPAGRTARGGLLTPHSGGGISSHARGLLRGAPALTATGLAPASSMRHEPPRKGEAARSGRTIGGGVSPPGGGAGAGGRGPGGGRPAGFPPPPPRRPAP